jgi:nicotinate phosphoribosyltransferase
MPSDAAPRTSVSPLVTDLYQLTMLDAYRRLEFRGVASFDLYARRLPENRGFLLVAGVEQALEYLERLRFSADEADWLASLGRFGDGFAAWLRDFRFTGDVHALPEGTVAFAEEPWLRVVAPLPEAQLVESRLLNLLHFQTLIASKAARCVLAARGRGLVDFGMRRAHGAEAAVLAARAAAIAGFDGTATVEAGRRFGIPLYGTMAHSFVQAHATEAEAFANYARCHAGRVTLLLDTYDTIAATHEVVRLVRSGVGVQGVRIDSGDLGAVAREVRAILDAGGCRDLRILASGNLDEHSIAELVRTGAPIDSFGVGTRLDASVDAPTLDAVYKLDEYDGRPRRKRSAAKETWPGRKQLWRELGPDGRILRDTVTREDERAPGEPLLQCVMRGGQRVHGREPITAIAERATRELAALPERSRRLVDAEPVVAEISAGIRALAAEADAAQRR